MKHKNGSCKYIIINPDKGIWRQLDRIKKYFGSRIKTCSWILFKVCHLSQIMWILVYTAKYKLDSSKLFFSGTNVRVWFRKE